MDENKIKRRKFIYYSGLGAAAVITWPFVSACNAQDANHKTAGVLSKDFKPDLDIELAAVERDLPLLSGKPTRVWRFEGKLITGDAGSLQQINKSYPGPVIRVQKGQKLRIRFINKIKEVSIVHWHGMHVPEIDDGHPKNVISPGETYIYEFEIMNRAGTYWFHPHPHGRTGPQIYHGMAGMLIVTDKEEQALGLPSGDFDIPFIIQDRKFDADN